MPSGGNGKGDGSAVASATGGSPATIQSVERAAQVLSFFTVGRPRLTLAEITARLGVHKATAHRYTIALRRADLLRYDRLTSEYTLGPQILTLAAAARAGLPIIGLAGPLMENLVREVNETVVLSIWDGEAPIIVRVDDNTERLVRLSVRTGSRLSARDSAQGRVFVTYLPAEQTQETQQLLAEDESLRAEVARIRESGLAINTPQIHGVRTVAAPVFRDGRIVAVMAIIGTIATVPDDLHSAAARALKRTADQLTGQFGDHELSGAPPSAISRP